MAFNVSQFRANMQFDGARPNLFEVEMVFPSFSLPGGASRKFNFVCKTAQIPGSTVGIVPVRYFGREIKFAGNRTFADWTVNVLNDEDFVVRNALERWMNGINSHRFNTRQASAANPASYSADAVVRHYGKTGNVIKTYRFIGLFPNDLAPIDLDWGNNDSIEEYSVTFAYQWWEAAAESVV